jgi:hypothetical protein
MSEMPRQNLLGQKKIEGHKSKKVFSGVGTNGRRGGIRKG